MKSLTYFNPVRELKEGDSIRKILLMKSRFDVAYMILNQLKCKGEMSRREIDKRVKELSGKAFDITPVLKCTPEISTEVRAEEVIKVRMKHARFGRITKVLGEENTVIFTPGYNPDNYPFLVEDAQILDMRPDHMGSVMGTIKVQVMRKYYKWVG